MASLIRDNFIFKSKSDVSCRICNKQFKCAFNGDEINCSSLYRHYRKMHPTSIEKGLKYPTQKWSPCDLNDEGPQTKYHKVGDQNLHQFENIGAMKGGGVINEEESLYSDNESNDVEANDDEVEDDNDVETGDEDNNESNDEGDNENSVNDSDDVNEDNDDDESDDDGDEEDNEDQSIGSDLSEDEEDDENILSKRETHEIKKLINFMRPIIIGGEKFMRILDEGSFFFFILGYAHSEDEELNCLSKKIYKSQQKLIDFLKNDVRKIPLNGALDKIFNLFSDEKIRKSEELGDMWYDHEDFFCNFLNETSHKKKAQLFTEAINGNVIKTTKLIGNMYKVYTKFSICYIKCLRMKK